ncbi:DUF642 domain-containing protein [Roseateles violae]|uniref:DUF642 domain-containing protein n=1 Tax=Roseateles violae TaxID=3058042 RepID=A0ABT8DMN9_9BURK|nr:DUF642 domain-containing protein [Pelomonas sp. PFR6]MDN3919662.1 DUF642 domain-containing protein [Pelomonas sp. PFR6]
MKTATTTKTTNKRLGLLSSGLALLLASFGASAAGGNLLVNGSFEDIGGAALQGWGGYTFGAGYSDTLAGWTISSGSVDVTVTGSAWGAAQDGVHSLDLNGWESGVLSQQLQTQIGQSYQVSFAFSRNASGAPDPAIALVTAGNAALQLSAPNDAGRFGSPYAMKWEQAGFQFTATEALTTLSFSASVPGNGGVYLDAVSVTALTAAPVPEPESYALMLAGLAAVGFIARRRGVARS